MDKTALQPMFENLLHIWNKTSFWNPKMKSYIYGSVNWIHVVNLLETRSSLDIMIDELKKLTSEGKSILLVGTKLQSKDAFRKLAEATDSYYVTDKWVPGLLTNFNTIKKRINTYIRLAKDAETGGLDILSKKEQASKKLELEKLDKAYSGLKNMKKLPDVIIVSDGIYEIQALKEANTLKIKSYAIFNTNWDDRLTPSFIVANTNSTKSFDYIANELKKGFVKSTKSTNTSRVKKIKQDKPILTKDKID